MTLKMINTLIKKTRRWHKKTGFPLLEAAAKYFERKKKEIIFKAIDDLKVQPETSNECLPEPSRIIWICWFQGLDNAPELVKRCIESVQLHSPDAKVVILTDENIPDYLSLPEHINSKYSSGLISKAQYSDIVRCSLLYQYGGIWMDSTVFLTKAIPESFYEKSFSSLRFDNNNGNALSQGFWTAYFIASQKGNPLIKLVRDILYSYWKHHNVLIEYFLIDYSFLYARERYASYQQIMSEQPITGNARFLIRQYMNHVLDTTAIQVLSSDPIGIYKLSHKEKYRESENGQPTAYSKILQGIFEIH